MQLTIEQEFEEFHYALESTAWQTSLPSFQLYTSKIVSSSPKVSVIIANFNNAPYLNKMLDSLVNQTIGSEHLQIMFIDDKSTDKSLEIVMPYLDKYQGVEIYALDKNTGGAHGPRNVGILNARGEYLVFLDADDWYNLDALRYLSDLLDDSGDDFAVSGLVQSKNGEITLKSKPYFYDGDFKNRSIQELPTELYGWLGPQAIMLRRSLVIENNLHFVNQRVADDVTFFYEALRFSKTITQGSRLTTYLNRDADNVSLSKAINRNFMISWLRALSFINQKFPDDDSKRRFLSRRIEWLVHDFIFKPNIGYKFSKKRMLDFKAQLDYYLPNLGFDVSFYFKNHARKVAWDYLEKKAFSTLFKFISLFLVRYILFDKLKLKKMSSDAVYYPELFRIFPNIKVDLYAKLVKKNAHSVEIQVFSNSPIKGFALKDSKNPFYGRKCFEFEQLSETRYVIKDFDDKNLEKLQVYNSNYLEVGISNV